MNYTPDARLTIQEKEKFRWELTKSLYLSTDIDIRYNSVELALKLVNQLIKTEPKSISNSSETPNSCEHKSDRKIYTSYPAQYRCEKCKEFYGQ